MSSPSKVTQTNAFFIQSAISFMASSCGIAIGIALLPAPAWVRGFLGLAALYLVTSSFTLAKCVRDRQEQADQEHRLQHQAAAIGGGAPWSG